VKIKRLASLVGAAVACASVVLLAASAASARTSVARHVLVTPATLPLRTAFVDPRSFSGTSPAFGVAAAAGASDIRVLTNWNGLAPEVRPAGFVASDPAGYAWSALDAQVKAAEAAGLTPFLNIVSPPRWAYAIKPQGVNGGTPDISELGQFAKALALHYDGRHGVPAVHVFQVWNEPNNTHFLSPVNPAAYRAMVNAVANSVRSASPSNLVVAGGLEPRGHAKRKTQQWWSMAPLAYMRGVLCVSSGTHPHATCKQPAQFEIWAHHPYTYDGPLGSARQPNDVEVGDLPKMRKLLNAGVRLHQIVSARPLQFWVTEFSWTTGPPHPRALPLPRAARWTAESLHQMWRSGVSLVTWFLLQDFPSPSPYQSGLYFDSKSITTARAKPTLTAFRFPFVAYLKGGAVSVWGRDGTSDSQLVAIQLRHGSSGSWRTVATIRANASGIFKANLKRKAVKKDWLRAVAPGSGTSLAFSLTVPPPVHYGPWGN
jgi:hypothetical protein